MEELSISKKTQEQVASVQKNIPSVMAFPTSNTALQAKALYEIAYSVIGDSDTCLIIGDTGADASALRQLKPRSQIIATNLAVDQLEFVRDQFDLDFLREIQYFAI